MEKNDFINLLASQKISIQTMNDYFLLNNSIKLFISTNFKSYSLSPDSLYFFESEILAKPNMLASIILSKLGLSSEKIYARDCEIKEISSSEKNEFLNANHLQGEDRSSVKLGLFYNDSLVAVSTFGKPRFNKKYDWELIRFCSKLKTNVLGGFSKLLKYFVKTYQPNNILSYSDRRFSIGQVYSKNNFSFLHSSQPNYFYTKDDIILESREKYQKHKLANKLKSFDGTSTEVCNMISNGFHQVFDFGTDVFVLDLCETCYIYCLIDPETNKIRYVGKTNNIEERLNTHLKTSQLKLKSKKNNWIKNLLSKNLQPDWAFIEVCPFKNWQEREVYWIKEFKRLGLDLTNGTDGGDGWGLISEEAKEKISASNKGKIHSDEWKKEMSEKMSGENNPFFGKTHTKSTVEKNRTSHLGKTPWNKGKKLSEEHIGNLKLAWDIKKQNEVFARTVKQKNASSKYLGVSFSKKEQKFFVRVSILNKRQYLCYNINELHCAKVYDDFMWETYHKKELLNFPENY